MNRERLQNLAPLLLIAFALIGFLLHRLGVLVPIEGLLARVTTPLQEGGSFVSTQFGELSQTARDLRGLRERNEALEAENASLLLEIVRLREVETEAVLLRDLLGFAQADSTLEVLRYVTLDIGREAGVARNMPVVTERGLVGRVSEAGDGWSQVLLIIDVSSSVNALTQSTRASGLVEGQADGSLVMRAIPQSDTISVGDTVFTSGLGGNFPRQILIGQITEVERKDYDLYQVASVEPTVDFDHLEAALVIIGFDPIGSTKSEESQP